MMKSRRLLLAGRSLYPLIASRSHVPRGHRRLRGRHRGQLRDVGPGRLVGLFVAGGLLVASRKRMLGTIFACLVIIVGVYVVSRGLVGLTAWVRNQHTEEHPCPSPCRRCAGTLW
jgi:uncharacterized membrane protein YfcA